VFVDAVERLARLRTDMPVVVLAGETAEVDAVDVVQAGAAGFLTREASIDALAATVA
jgi:DNA-binding NarL/FixJ family response regulator